MLTTYIVLGLANPGIVVRGVYLDKESAISKAKKLMNDGKNYQMTILVTRFENESEDELVVFNSDLSESINSTKAD